MGICIQDLLVACSAHGVSGLALPKLGVVKLLWELKYFVDSGGEEAAGAQLLVVFSFLGQDLPAVKQLDNFCATKPTCLLTG